MQFERTPAGKGDLRSDPAYRRERDKAKGRIAARTPEQKKKDDEDYAKYLADPKRQKMLKERKEEEEKDIAEHNIRMKKIIDENKRADRLGIKLGDRSRADFVKDIEAAEAKEKKKSDKRIHGYLEEYKREKERDRVPKIQSHGSERDNCKKCDEPHTKNEHRFHGDGAFCETHLSESSCRTSNEAHERQLKRDRRKARWSGR